MTNCSEPEKGSRLLDKLEIASPCPANWDEMIGDDRERFCMGCSKNVYNISTMNAIQAEEFLQSLLETQRCVKFARRHDGTIITDDCPRGLRALRESYKKTAKMASSFILFLSGLLLAFPQAKGKDSSQNTAPKKAKKAIRYTVKEKPSKQEPFLHVAGLPTFFEPPGGKKDKVNNCQTNNSETEARLKKQIENSISTKTENSIDGVRNYLDLASFYRSQGRFEDSKSKYERAIELLNNMPEESKSKLLENARLNLEQVMKELKVKSEKL